MAGTEGLMALLARPWNDETQQRVRQGKDTHVYLDHLTNLPVDQLLQEPHQLRDKLKHAQDHAQKSAYRDYPAFLCVQECRQTMGETLGQLDTTLDDMTTLANQLDTMWQTSSEEARIHVHDRTKITHALEYHDVLADLFEMPQLMETCVRNHYYNDAMNLASHVRLLVLQYPLPVIKAIHEQVQASADRMLTQLLAQLRGPIKLVTATEAIGYLRRMEVFGSEVELRMVFLRCRKDYLEQRLERIKPKHTGDTATFLRKYIDVLREQVLETANQYTSVFLHKQCSLLSDYMVRLILQMQDTLQEHLPFVQDPSEVNSLSLQLHYCGQSLGRIGLDFRSLMVPILESCIQHLEAPTDTSLTSLTKVDA